MTSVEKVTFCRICEPCCGLVATVRDGRLEAVRPDRDNPISAGCSCPKGIESVHMQNDPDRVLHPLRRHEEGTFRRVSWEMALGLGPPRRRVAGRQPGGRRQRQPARLDQPEHLEPLAGMSHLNGIPVRLELPE